MSFSFCPPEHRCVESAKIRNKYPDRVPVSEVSVRSEAVGLARRAL